jgi:hypothetical protein
MACLAQAVEGQTDPTPVHEAAMHCLRTKLIGFLAKAVASIKTATGALLPVKANSARGLADQGAQPSHKLAILSWCACWPA